MKVEVFNAALQGLNDQLFSICGIDAKFTSVAVTKEPGYYKATSKLAASDLGIFSKGITSASLELELFDLHSDDGDFFGGRIALTYQHGIFARGGSNGINLSGIAIEFKKNAFTVAIREIQA